MLTPTRAGLPSGDPLRVAVPRALVARGRQVARDVDRLRTPLHRRSDCSPAGSGGSASTRSSMTTAGCRAHEIHDDEQAPDRHPVHPQCSGLAPRGRDLLRTAHDRQEMGLHQQELTLAAVPVPTEHLRPPLRATHERQGEPCEQTLQRRPGYVFEYVSSQAGRESRPHARLVSPSASYADARRLRQTQEHSSVRSRRGWSNEATRRASSPRCKR